MSEDISEFINRTYDKHEFFTIRSMVGDYIEFTKRKVKAVIPSERRLLHNKAIRTIQSLVKNGKTIKHNNYTYRVIK